MLFEAPHRIEALCASLAALCPQRSLSLCRELTKQFESVHTLPAGEAPGWLAQQPQRSRGEFVVVSHALNAPTSDGEHSAHEATLCVLLRELPLKQSVSLAAEITGASRKVSYARALELKKAADSR